MGLTESFNSCPAVCVSAFSVLKGQKKKQSNKIKKRKKKEKVSPFIWSESVTVEVRAINEETRSLDHVLCYHTQTVENIAQLAGTERERLEMSF